MISCKEVVRILSEERPQGLGLNLQLRFHLAMCESCRTFKASLKKISDLHQAAFSKFTQDHAEEIENSKKVIKSLKK